MTTWEKQVVMLSGASMGIGRALALELARQGAVLALNARGAEALEATAAECRGAGATVETLAGDIGDPTVAAALADKARSIGNLGGPHVVIHAAGVFAPGPLLTELAPKNFASVMQSSVFGTYSLARATFADLAANSGTFVVFGSGAAEIVQPGIGAYCAAKAAEERLAKQLAAEHPEVTTIIYRPGIVETRMQEQGREAKGGAAKELHDIYRPWKERGALLTPEQSAHSLLEILTNNPRQHHGQAVRAQ